MNKRWIVSSFVFFIATGLFVFKALALQPSGDNLTEQELFISVPDLLKELERPPVKFNHSRHTKALEKEGCEKCHPLNKNEKMVFEFPKKRIEKDRDSFMSGFHDACIACHTLLREEKTDSGPVTCGGCHVVADEYNKIEYLPILPEYYDSMRDTYHKNCLACHKDPEKKVEDAGGLDWKNFYVKENKKTEEDLPKTVFDYYLHDKHEAALDKKCQLCHYLAEDTGRELREQGKEPECKDWLNETPEEYDLSQKQTAHYRCINCHLEIKAEQRATGPVNCTGCHSGTCLTTEEQLKEAVGPSCNQEDRILIQIQSRARMDAVVFNHKLHQEKVLSCQACHHKTVNKCVSCHSLAGEEAGGFITLAEAYHDISSGNSCIGCHEKEKNKKDCAGCHNLLKKGLEQTDCITCHSGSVESLGEPETIQYPGNQFPEQIVKDKIEIDLLADEFKAAEFPHLKIIKALIDVSNNNSLARYFHKGAMTICSSCHHYSPVSEGKKVPLCRTCHTSRRTPAKARPALLGAYHQQCLGCHKQMDGVEDNMPQSCTGCQEENSDKKVVVEDEQTVQ